MNQEKHYYYLYSITCLFNNKTYIGISNRFRHRVSQHLYDLKINNHCNRFLQADYNTYGKDQFVFDIIEIYDDKAGVLRAEKYLTDVVFNLNEELCYNIVSGGSGANLSVRKRSRIAPITDATRILLSKRSAAQKQTIETRQKRIATLKGANCYRAKKVIDTKTGKIYGCLKDVKDDFDINYNTLRTWLNGVRPNKSTLLWH